MIEVSTIVARIKSEIPAGFFRFIGTENDFMDAFEKRPASPSCYVLPPAEMPNPEQAATGMTTQRVRVQFTLILAISRPRDRDEDGAANAETLREALKDALLGWMPDGATDPVIYAGFRMLGLAPDGGSIFWGFDVSTAYYERRTEVT